MFGIGGGEFLVIALVALIAVGPEQLPSVMRKFGGYVTQLRKMADGVRGEFMTGADQLDPVKWTGDGSDDKPIVPRGFAESATTTLGTPVAKPRASNDAIDQAFGKKAEPGVDTTEDATESLDVTESNEAPADTATTEPLDADADAVEQEAVATDAIDAPDQEPPAS